MYAAEEFVLFKDAPLTECSGSGDAIKVTYSEVWRYEADRLKALREDKIHFDARNVVTSSLSVCVVN